MTRTFPSQSFCFKIQCYCPHHVLVLLVVGGKLKEYKQALMWLQVSNTSDFNKILIYIPTSKYFISIILTQCHPVYLSEKTKACIPLEITGKRNRHKQHEMYMPAPRIGDPTPPIFHLLTLGVGVGDNANFGNRVGGNANLSIFTYQHVGIPNAKLWRWGSEPTG